MLTYNAAFEQELLTAIGKKITFLRDTLETNAECRVDFVRGQINGLRMMDDIIAEAREAAEQENR